MVLFSPQHVALSKNSFDLDEESGTRKAMAILLSVGVKPGLRRPLDGFGLTIDCPGLPRTAFDLCALPVKALA